MVKAFAMDSLDAPAALRNDLPEPAPGENEVLVRVRASSANPVDNAIAGGMLAEMLEHEFPLTLGRDYAGVVETVGAGVTRYAPGDEVYGYVPHANPAVHDGSWTELIVVPEDNFVASKPGSVDMAAAGAAPLAGIAAVLALDALDVSEGDTLLLVGATGGVGGFAVQLAAHAGATVIAPALAEDETYLRSLGVGELLDREGDVAGAARAQHPDGIDALLDLASYDSGGFEAHASALKERGRGASPIGAAGDGPGRTNLMAASSPENLKRLARLLDDGTVRVPIQESYALDRAGDALQTLASEHTQGKLGIRVA
jgi:NADPH:quinone reductase-like Zn-dependent oxidoreductase